MVLRARGQAVVSIQFTRRQSTIQESLSSCLHHHHTTSLASTLRSCAHNKALADGHTAHTVIASLGLEQNKLLANLLVHMYGGCGFLHDACHLFSNLPKRDPFSWNFMMSAYARMGHLDAALHLFSDMRLQGVKPDKYIFASILSACVDEGALISGMYIHFLIISDESDLDVVLANAIINMYAKCGHIDDAQVMFVDMPEKTEASYNAMVSGYALNGHGNMAIMIFEQMIMEGLLPGKVTFLAVISACICGSHVREGKHMHARLAECEHKSDVALGNTLINMYGKCRDLNKGLEVFDSLPQRSIVSWNAMISSCSQHSEGQKALELFDHLHQEGELPNSVTFFSLLPAFDPLSLKQRKRLHTRVMSVDLETRTSNLIYLYCKCCSYIDAQELFDSMLEHDLLAWNALIGGYSQHSQVGKPTLWQLNQMLQEGILPDKCTFLNVLLICANQVSLTEGSRLDALLAGSKLGSDTMIGSALLNMYGKCGCLGETLVTFSQMAIRTDYSWAAVIAAYATHGDARNALVMFEQMQWEGIEPNKVCILGLLCACSKQAALTHCKHAHTYVLETGLVLDVTVGNALLTMYSKCGSLEYAIRVFNTMPKKDLVSWTAVIAACAQHGQGKQAFFFLEETQKKKVYLDKVTFAEILSACSRAGLMDEACHVLTSIKQGHGFDPTVDHYNCVIDLLSRAGRLDLAEHVILNMQPRPTAVSWLTLLGACRAHLDLERGERAAKHVCFLSLNDASPLVTLSNLYAESGRFDDAAYTFQQMWHWSEEQQEISYSFEIT